MDIIQVQFKWLAFDRIRNTFSMVIVQKAECRNIYILSERFAGKKRFPINFPLEACNWGGG